MLVVECNANRLASLCDALRSRGVGAVYATTGDAALDTSRQLCPHVTVVSSPPGVPGAADTLDALHGCADVSRRPIMMARSVDDTRVEWTRWDGWIPRSTDTGEVARLVMGILGK